MNKEDVKKEFAKTILYAKMAAALFFVLLAPSIVMTVKDIPELYGFSKDMWFYASVVGFLVYGGFTFMFWKCPKCKSFPGRGWFRKNCESCGVELT